MIFYLYFSLYEWIWSHFHMFKGYLIFDAIFVNSLFSSFSFYISRNSLYLLERLALYLFLQFFFFIFNFEVTYGLSSFLEPFKNVVGLFLYSGNESLHLHLLKPVWSYFYILNCNPFGVYPPQNEIWFQFYLAFYMITYFSQHQLFKVPFVLY